MAINLTVQPTDDIQTYIDICNDNGGGIITLSPATYNLTDNITLYDGIYLKGAVSSTTILDFGGLPYGVKIEGQNSYTDGTVSTTYLSSTVLGVDTAWDSSMIGQTIFLQYSYYEIADVVSVGELTLATPYEGTDIVGATYAIADLIGDIFVQDLTIQNSADIGISFKYVYIGGINNVNINNCNVGTQLDYTQSVGIFNNGMSIDSCNYGIIVSKSYSWTLETTSVSNTLIGDGVQIIDSGDATVYNFSSNNGVANGVSITGGSTIAFMSVTVSYNGNNGIELIDRNSDNQFTNLALVGNTNDAYKITYDSDRIFIGSSTIKDSGGYGVEILDATCENTLILGNFFINNTSGECSDSGGFTLIRSNVNLIDN